MDLWISFAVLLTFASFPCTSLGFMLTLIIFDPPETKKKCETSSCKPSLFEIVAPSRRESSFFSSSTSGFVDSHSLQLRIYSFLQLALSFDLPFLLFFFSFCLPLAFGLHIQLAFSFHFSFSFVFGFWILYFFAFLCLHALSHSPSFSSCMLLLAFGSCTLLRMCLP